MENKVYMFPNVNKVVSAIADGVVSVSKGIDRVVTVGGKTLELIEDFTTLCCNEMKYLGVERGSENHAKLTRIFLQNVAEFGEETGVAIFRENYKQFYKKEFKFKATK